TGVAALHHDEHGHGLAGGDEVVHDVIDAALDRPGAFVLAAAVLEIEDGITGVAGRVVARRGVDEKAAEAVGEFGAVPAFADRAVRHVMDLMIRAGVAGFGDLDAAGGAAGAEEGFAGGVV